MRDLLVKAEETRQRSRGFTKIKRCGGGRRRGNDSELGRRLLFDKVQGDTRRRRGEDSRVFSARTRKIRDFEHVPKLARPRVHACGRRGVARGGRVLLGARSRWRQTRVGLLLPRLVPSTREILASMRVSSSSVVHRRRRRDDGGVRQYRKPQQTGRGWRAGSLALSRSRNLFP